MRRIAFVLAGLALPLASAPIATQESFHQHYPNIPGEVVFENDTIIFVGRDFGGPVDKEIDASGMLVSPGFIDTHVHAGYQAQKRMITDVGRPDYFGQPFLEFDVGRAGTVVGGDPRFFSEEDKQRVADRVARENVLDTVRLMKEQSEAIRRLTENGTIAVVGAMYDVGTGAVEFLTDLQPAPPPDRLLTPTEELRVAVR